MDFVGQLRTALTDPRRQEPILRFAILALCYIVAFTARLYSVVRFESVIHEFDPYFNYRTTKYLAEEGFYSFINWFDDGSWYPLGRIIGGTIYPGLMVTSALVYWGLHAIHVTMSVRNICVFLAPWFASNTTIATYLFAKEVRDRETGLIAAAFIAIVPGYISRSVAGSYDNEGIAIFALIMTFYLFVKSVNTGSLLHSCLASLAYFYMVMAWGGYIFIINLIPMYVIVLVVIGSYSTRLYIAYSSFYIIGTLLAMQIAFVGFNAVQSSEHMAAMGTFLFLQVYTAIHWVRKHLTGADKLFRLFLQYAAIGIVGLILVSGAAMAVTGYRIPWAGRFYTLLDPTYAKEHIPIIASVSEHQPTAWSSFFFDLHILALLFPAGMYFCFKKLTDANIFIVMYGLTSVYFAGVMVRLMLVLSPAACVLGAIAVSSTLRTHVGLLKRSFSSFTSTFSSSSSSAASASSGGSSSSSSSHRGGAASASSGANKDNLSEQRYYSLVVIAGITLLLCFFVFHCSWVTSEAYSSPSIVLAAKQSDGSRVIFDDFREAYYWLRMNSAPNAKIMSWWDYGYQITSIANRTILVDNNTWNNTHIATVGMAMASPEPEAYEIMSRLDVDYVLVVFGGLTGYASDDINKFLWMVRIGGGVFPHIRESDYFTPQGEFKVDKDGAPKLLNSLMYKMCYYRFGEMMTEHGKGAGYDRVRQAEIGFKDIKFDYMDEAFTSEHWIVRIFKVRKFGNRQ